MWPLSPVRSSVAETGDGVVERIGAHQLRRGVGRAGSAQRVADADPGDEHDQHRQPTAGRIIRPRSVSATSRERGSAQASARRRRPERPRRARSPSGSRAAPAAAALLDRAGSRSTAGASQRSRSRQRSQPARWRSIAPASRSSSAPERVGGEVVAQRGAVAHGSTSEGPSIPMPSASVARIFSMPSRIRPLTVPERLAQHLGDLGVAEAAEVGELDHLATAPRAARSGRPRTSRAVSRRIASTSVSSAAGCARAPRRRRGRASAPSPRPRRSASIARLRTMPERPGANAAAGAVVAGAAAPDRDEAPPG